MAPEAGVAMEDWDWEDWEDLQVKVDWVCSSDYRLVAAGLVGVTVGDRVLLGCRSQQGALVT
jgi:hypothetical protein